MIQGGHPLFSDNGDAEIDQAWVPAVYHEGIVLFLQITMGNTGSMHVLDELY